MLVVWPRRLMETLIVVFFVALTLLSAPIPIYAAAASPKWGVLVVAHGTNDPQWIKPVWEAVYEMRDNFPYPVALGFLEDVEPDIPAAVEQLNDLGVDRIVAVPLFISSYSNHIEEIKYILGLRDELPGDEHSEPLERANPRAEVILTAALDDHPLLAEVLADQMSILLKNATNEVGVLAAHGSDTVEGQQGWLKNMGFLAEQIQEIMQKKGGALKNIRSGFLFEGLSPSLHEAVYQAVYEDGATALVVPVMISEGYFTGRKITGILNKFPEGTYRYLQSGQRALLTFRKSSINRIMEWRAANEVWTRPTILKEGKTEELTLDKCQEIAHSAGKGYPCSVLAFRLLSMALPVLWPDGPAVADDLQVISLLPPEAGSKEVFSYLTGSSDVKYLGNWQRITLSSPTFILGNKASGEMLWIYVKPQVLGGNDFFELRNRVINGSASESEQVAYEQRMDLMLKNLLTKPVESIFEWKKVSPIIVYGTDGSLKRISYPDLAVENNKLCLCGSMAFRMMSESLARLYNKEVPRQGRFVVTSGWGTDGIEYALKQVAGEGNYTIQGGEPINSDSYFLTVYDRDTSRTIIIKAHPQLFDEAFFYLKSKIKHNMASTEEKLRFQELRMQVIGSLLNKTSEENFAVDIFSGGGNSGKSKGRGYSVVGNNEKTGDTVTSRVGTSNGLPVETTYKNSMQFKDLEGHWVTKALERLSEKKILTGYPDGTFRPERKVNRAEFVCALVRALEITANNEQYYSFQDEIRIPDWARNSVAAAVKHGLVKGYTQKNGKLSFEPDRAVSRLEMAVIVARILEHKNGNIKPEASKIDHTDIPVWAKSSVEVVVSKGIMRGYPDGALRLNDSVTRAEMAVVILRLMEVIGEKRV